MKFVKYFLLICLAASFAIPCSAEELYSGPVSFDAVPSNPHAGDAVELTIRIPLDDAPADDRIKIALLNSDEREIDGMVWDDVLPDFEDDAVWSASLSFTAQDGMRWAAASWRGRDGVEYGVRFVLMKTDDEQQAAEGGLIDYSVTQVPGSSYRRVHTRARFSTLPDEKGMRLLVTQRNGLYHDRSYGIEKSSYSNGVYTYEFSFEVLPGSWRDTLRWTIGGREHSYAHEFRISNNYQYTDGEHWYDGLTSSSGGGCSAMGGAALLLCVPVPALLRRRGWRTGCAG